MSTIVAIAAVEVRAAVEDLVAKQPEASLEDRAQAAMKNARRSWCCTGEKEQFLAACEGLYATASEDEQERIREDLEALGRVSALLNALSAGIPVDLEAMAAQAEEQKPSNPLGLRRLWQETAR